MNTESKHRRHRTATAIVLGCALAITPLTSHAVPDATVRDGGSFRFVPNDNDPRGHHVVRQAVPPAQPNLRQQMEADRGPTSEVQPYQRRPIEDDRSIEPVPPPRVPLNDTDPREHRHVRGPSAAPDVYIHLRILSLG